MNNLSDSAAKSSTESWANPVAADSSNSTWLPNPIGRQHSGDRNNPLGTKVSDRLNTGHLGKSMHAQCVSNLKELTGSVRWVVVRRAVSNRTPVETMGARRALSLGVTATWDPCVAGAVNEYHSRSS